MIMNCKKCGKDLTSQAILMLENKIAKINCECSSQNKNEQV
jgi:transcription elongation factor Elf1